MRIAIATVFGLLVTTAAHGQPYDYVFGGVLNPCRTVLACSRNVTQRVVAGQDWSVPETAEATVLAAAPQGRLLGIPEYGRGLLLYEVRQGAPDRLLFESASFDGEAVVVNAAGTAYVVGYQGGASVVVEIDSSGTARDVHTLSAGSGGPIDLAADQCTLFVRGPGAIRRFNVCTGTPLPDFAPLASSIDDLKILPDGGVVVSRGPAVTVYNVDGTLRRNYTAPRVEDRNQSKLAIDSTGRVIMLLAGHSEGYALLIALDLPSGIFQRLGGAQDFELDVAHAVVAANGWTAAIGPFLPANGHSGAEVPTTSEWGLIALAALVAFAAIRRIA